MTLKEQLIQQIEQLPEEQLQKVWEFVRSLKSAEQEDEDRAWKAYQRSVEEREEVYRRLADS